MQRFYRLVFSLFFLCCFAAIACRDNPARSTTSKFIHLEGKTMGTYYKVTYEDIEGRNFQRAIDSLLIAINLEVSTYIDSSVISRFNQAESEFKLKGSESHFIANFLESRRIHALTKGAFDPTVMPLVNYWGFGYTPKMPVEKVDSVEVAKLLKLVGFQQITGLEEGETLVLLKPDAGMQLDFSGIASGYGIDQVGAFLLTQNIQNILVDIGGEARAWGISERGDVWRIGINIPEEEASLTALFTAIQLNNMAVSTSGNYRNLYEVGGVKYSHTINPWTGFPERNRLLSATLLASNCMEADALATACMVFGLKKAQELVSSLPDVHALFIYSNDDGSMQSWTSPGMAEFIIPGQQ